MIDRICSLLHIKKPSSAAGYLFASGSTVPTDATSGYQPGCIFQHTDGSAGGVLYVNDGTYASCDFNPVQPNAVTGDVAIAAGGAATLNSAHAQQEVLIPLTALTAGNDLAATVQFSDPRGVTLVSAALIMQSNAIGTIDDSNTSVVAITDGASNSIVSKTYNTATQPTAPGVNDLGALDATNKVLTANETVSIAITNGATAATPASLLRLVFEPTNA